MYYQGFDLYSDDTHLIGIADNLRQLEVNFSNAINWSEEDKLNISYEKPKYVRSFLYKQNFARFVDSRQPKPQISPS